MNKVKVGVALGGGGVRGFCHLGALKALEELNIPIYAICGTSMGAVIGGAYASGCEISALEKACRKFSLLKVLDLNSHLIKQSLLRGGKMKKFLQKNVICETMQQCPIKFCSVAYDMNSNKTVYLEQGNLVENIYASMAVPAVFKPEEKNGMMLVDGGILDNLPEKHLKEMGCDVVIAIDPIGDVNDGKKFKKNLIATLFNIINIHTRRFQELEGHVADFVINPHVEGIVNLDFNKKNFSKAQRAGSIAIRKKINDIKKFIAEKEGENND